MAAPPCDDVPKTEFEVPEGWIFVTKPNRKGQLVKYYTNILGQRFYNEANLMRNIIDSNKKGFAIYTPDFESPTSRPFAMGRKSEVEASSSNAKHASRNKGRRAGLNSKSKGCIKPKKEKVVESHLDVECATALLDLSIEDKTEVQCARALMEISGQTTSDCWASRRLPGSNQSYGMTLFQRSLGICNHGQTPTVAFED
ncbi:hypothetical protein DH2020_049978 [Rehmannia glutinosa]|uniref:MBD domain-containing protein n=1 Tax=Rehmannia glutinosa TaxID=99300 RepID=A0ABR0U1C6_REHGL